MKIRLSLKTAVFCFCLFFCVSCSTQTGSEEKKAVVTPEKRILQHISDLSEVSFSGRRAGSGGEAKASFYLAAHLKKVGLITAGEGGTFFQTFPLGRYETVMVDNRMTFRLADAVETLYSENVLGFLPGQSDRVIVISAHYDHLGVIAGQLYGGANDNASGVALVMELASALQEEKPRCSILFAFWGAEEEGLLGSRHFCQHPTIPLDKIACVVNLDSVGITEGKRLLGWAGPENEESRHILSVLREEGWEVLWEKTEKHASDHLPFAQKNISGFSLLSEDWLKDNHTTEDKVGKIKLTALVKLFYAIKTALLA